MTDDELVKVLKKFETTRVEKLNDNSKRLFYAIMKIADERDELKEENQRLNNDIKVLLKENEAKEKVIIKQDNVLNELEKWLKSEVKRLEKIQNDTKNVKPYGQEYNNYTFLIGVYDNVLDNLNELKESDK